MPFSAPPTRQKWYQWVPTDARQLQEAEARMLEPVRGEYAQFTVSTPLCDINTVAFTNPSHTQNVLLMHGFGFGLAQWIANFRDLSRCANVFAIDLPGFARSGRVRFSGGGQEAILFFIQTIEEWVKAMWPDATPSLPKLTIVGHSFGGFLAGKFALSYPCRVDKLVLVDAFGINEGVPEAVVEARTSLRSPLEKVRKFAAETIFYKVNPLAPFRGLGPLGPSIIGRKLEKKGQQWAPYTPPGAVMDYLYHCNAQAPSGETAFSKCISGMGAGFGDGFVAKFPLLKELPNLPPEIPLIFFYGAQTWIPHNAAYTVCRQREQAYEDIVAVDQAIRAENARNGIDSSSIPVPVKPVGVIHVLPEAGHHVYVDKAARFNRLLTEVLQPGFHRVHSEANRRGRTASDDPVEDVVGSADPAREVAAAAMEPDLHPVGI